LEIITPLNNPIVRNGTRSHIQKTYALIMKKTGFPFIAIIVKNIVLVGRRTKMENGSPNAHIKRKCEDDV
jgi:hypothetical protein